MTVVTTGVLNVANARKINWTNSIAFGLFHLGALAALFFFNWQALAVAVLLFWV